MKTLLVLGASAALACAAADAAAQSAADTRPLQENGPPALRPPAPNRAPVTVQPAPVPAPAVGGPSAFIRAITISGNTVFSREQLAAVLGPASGKNYDFSALAALVQRITAMYQAAGYPFARAYLPPQNLSAGQLRIEIL